MNLNSIAAIIFSVLVLMACDNKQDRNTVETQAKESAQPVTEKVESTTPAAPAQETIKQNVVKIERLPESIGGFPVDVLIDPNTATLETLVAIPKVTEEVAQVIINGRPFASPIELHMALRPVIGPRVLRNYVYPYMFIKVGLNSADVENYKFVPSTINRRKLAHEFEEYRPYESLEQFVKEMEKYVSAEEAAFLKRYVFVEPQS